MRHLIKTGLLRVKTTPQGVVILARGINTLDLYVAHNGKIWYQGKEEARAERVFHIIWGGCKFDENLARRH